MAQIAAVSVKDLRERSGAGMMDCKKALTECDGDIEAAVDWLRKKGLSAAAKKAGRTASEGLIGIATNGKSGAVVEVNAETDFVSRNENFQAFVKSIAGIVLEKGDDLESIKSASFPDTGRTVEEELTQMIATIGENMNLRRAQTLSVNEGVVTFYMHNALAPGLGKIGVLVALESSGDAAKLEAFGKQLAMHIAAANPLAVSREGVDASDLEREKDVLAEQARASGKPEEIIGKMVEGRLRKYYEEVCLLEQVWVIDGESKVEKVLETVAKDAGAPVAIKAFVRLALGEGVEKKEEDFAAEVAAAAGA
ncbi:MAG: translation elongation factor Ts [Rhodospirillales bacterium]|nr:translation elongation factor Ts [Rhodospirillales bacterium]